MHKKILIVNNNMHIGGVQRALADLLNEIHSDYEITLLLFNKGGELLDCIPDDVNVISAGPVFRPLGIVKDDRRVLLALTGKALLWIVFRLIGRKRTMKLMCSMARRADGFDCAISFLHSGREDVFYGGCCEYVLNCTDAKRKYAFLHCDFKSIGAASAYNLELYSSFDVVAACSNGCRDAFLSAEPEFRGAIRVVYNCHDFKRITKLAGAVPAPARVRPLEIVTVARLGREKGVLRAVEAISMLGKRSNEVHLRIIGSGIQHANAEELIHEKGMEGSIELMGETSNPYPFMKAADVLLIPSYSEAAPMVIDEAACLCTPVLSTGTCSAEELVSERGFGWVCGNSVEGITEALNRLLDSPQEIAERSSFLQTVVFDNSKALEGFRGLIGDEE